MLVRSRMLAVTCVVHSATMSMVRELRRVRVAGPASVRSLTQSPCVSHLSGHRPRPPTRPCAPRAGRRISAGRWVVGPRPRPVFYLNVAAQVSSKRTRAARRRKPRRRAPARGWRRWRGWRMRNSVECAHSRSRSSAAGRGPTFEPSARTERQTWAPGPRAVHAPPSQASQTARSVEHQKASSIILSAACRLGAAANAADPLRPLGRYMRMPLL